MGAEMIEIFINSYSAETQDRYYVQPYRDGKCRGSSKERGSKRGFHSTTVIGHFYENLLISS
jgi:hypothetical protein